MTAIVLKRKSLQKSRRIDQLVEDFLQVSSDGGSCGDPQGFLLQTIQ